MRSLATNCGAGRPTSSSVPSGGRTGAGFAARFATLAGAAAGRLTPTVSTQPASSATVRVTDRYPGWLIRIVWVPARSSLMVTGVTPFGTPSIRTRAPRGVEEMVRIAVAGRGAGAAVELVTGAAVFGGFTGGVTAGAGAF